jgi:hypothetical protein
MSIDALILNFKNDNIDANGLIVVCIDQFKNAISTQITEVVTYQLEFHGTCDSKTPSCSPLGIGFHHSATKQKGHSAEANFKKKSHYELRSRNIE